MRDKYIHYGSSKYDPNKFVEPKNNPYGYIISKPQGGLWASKVNSEWGWKDWCRSEDFHTGRLEESFTFELSDNANVKYLIDLDDIKSIPHIVSVDEGLIGYSIWINFEKAIKAGIDAIELVNVSEFYYPLYGWDCESIIILNKDIIIPD